VWETGGLQGLDHSDPNAEIVGADGLASTQRGGLPKTTLCRRFSVTGRSRFDRQIRRAIATRATKLEGAPQTSFPDGKPCFPQQRRRYRFQRHSVCRCSVAGAPADRGRAVHRWPASEGMGLRLRQIWHETLVRDEVGEGGLVSCRIMPKTSVAVQAPVVAARVRRSGLSRPRFPR